MQFEEFINSEDFNLIKGFLFSDLNTDLNDKLNLKENEFEKLLSLDFDIDLNTDFNFLKKIVKCFKKDFVKCFNYFEFFTRFNDEKLKIQKDFFFLIIYFQ